MPVETRKRKALAQAATANAEPAPSSSSTKRQKNLPMRSKDEAAAAKPDKKGNKITFDDDGNADQELVIPTKKPVEVSKSADEGDSDSDEAPEAVSTVKVADEMKKSALAEKKAAQEQAAAEKKKRQERDALFKQQASERKAESKPEEITALKQEQTGRKRSEKVAIPTILPAEFLTDSESEEDEGEEESTAADRPRKRKVSSIEKQLTKDGRGPRDEAIGSTVYRVTEKVDERLAPKVNKQSMKAKELLLSRGRAPVKSRSAGFIKKN